MWAGMVLNTVFGRNISFISNNGITNDIKQCWTVVKYVTSICSCSNNSGHGVQFSTAVRNGKR